MLEEPFLEVEHQMDEVFPEAEGAGVLQGEEEGVLQEVVGVGVLHTV